MRLSSRKFSIIFMFFRPLVQAPAFQSRSASGKKHGRFRLFPDGSFYVHQDLNFVRVSADGANKTVLLSDAQMFGMNSCPDGKTLLFSWVAHGGGRSISIWRVDENGSNPTQLSFGKLDFNPACSPDSKMVYFGDLGGTGVFGVPVDASRKPELVPGSIVPHTIHGDLRVGLSPDNKWLAILVTSSGTTENSNQQRIALVPLDQVRNRSSFPPAQSPRFQRPAL